MHEIIYLDEAATSMSNPEKRNTIADVVSRYINVKWHNPSANYKPAHWIRGEVERARHIVASFISANPEEIFFTSGGSESNCWAIKGFVDQYYMENDRGEPVIITTPIEHKSIMDCISSPALHAKVIELPVFCDGTVKHYELANALAKNHNRKILVSVQFANNEIGTAQNIKEIAQIAHSHNAIFHTDAVQAFGHLPIDVDDLEIDLLSASGHKIGAPKGIGFLYKRSGVDIQPLIHGSQMDGMRGGTENVPYIMALAEAVKMVDSSKQAALIGIRESFIDQLLARGCTLNGPYTRRLPNNVNVTFPDGISAESMLFLLDAAGIYASAGSACNAQSIYPSHVLKAIGLSNEEAARTLRFTLPVIIAPEDIHRVLHEIDKAIKILTTDERLLN